MTDYTSALVSNPTVGDVPGENITADAADYEKLWLPKQNKLQLIKIVSNFDPNKPVDQNNLMGQNTDLKLAEEVKRTITLYMQMM